MQLPLPLQTWPLPQLVPPGALVWVQTGAPVEQLIVPGLQVVPQVPDVQALQAPLPLHTMLVPHVVPAGAFVMSQTGAPVVQLAVPGLHVVPHDAPAVQATQLPVASQT